MRHSLATLVLMFAACVLTPHEGLSAQPDFFVASGGNDANPGTAEKPFATVARAKAALRQRIAAGLKADLTVVIRAGTYELAEPLVFGPADSGTDKCAITYAASPGETVVLSGGRKIGPWKQAEGNIWTTSVPDVRQRKWCFRNLFVNGRRAVRARTPNVTKTTDCLQLTAAALSKDLKKFTVTLPPGLAGNWRNQTDIELMIAGNWAINRKRVESIDTKTGTVVLAPPHQSGAYYILPKTGRWFHVENARELLDEPGQWYLDRQTGVLSYCPRPDEDMASAKAVAPVLVRLVEVRGTAERPVRNLHFKGISFKHTDWKLPADGYMGIQACHYQSKQTGSGRIPAAVHCTFARQLSVKDGSLARLGGCGIELTDGCSDCVVEGNHVFDISGNGINVGGANNEDTVPKNNRIANNHVHACGIEYYGAIGIWVGLAQRAILSHNLVHDLPYSGISVGWQWNPNPTACRENTVEYNHVYDVMNRLCDGGCIYTLGLQPGTVIRCNHLHDVHRSALAQGAPNNGMFIDQGSKGYLFERNVIYNTAAQLVRFNRCKREWHTWRDNHFGDEAEVKQAGKQIIAEAGLEKKPAD